MSCWKRVYQVSVEVWKLIHTTLCPIDQTDKEEAIMLDIMYLSDKGKSQAAIVVLNLHLDESLTLLIK